MSDVIEQVAKFLWEYDQHGTTAEWREMAWSDMGGSEPTDERQLYEIRARALADAGFLAQPLPTRAEAWHEGYGHGRDDQEAETRTNQMHVTLNPYRKAQA